MVTSDGAVRSERRVRRKRRWWGKSISAERDRRNRPLIARIKDWPWRKAIKSVLKFAGILLLLILVPALVLAASVAIPLLLYAPPQFGAVLPGGAVLVDGSGSNVYIVRDRPSHVVLVDCGADPKMTGVGAALQKWGLGLDAVDAVLITNAQRDHIAGCAAVPGARLVALAREAGAVEGSDIIPGPIATVTSLVTDVKPKPTGLYVAGRPTDGQAFMIGGLFITIYAAPGHTPGSAAYLIGPALFVGDAAAFGRTGSVVGAPWIYNSDGGQMAPSRNALATFLAPAHVEIVATGHTAPGQLKAMQ